MMDNDTKGPRSAAGDDLRAEYVAVKDATSGKWGFISPDGKLYCKDMLDEQPSPVVNGYFSARSGDSVTLYRLVDGDKPEAVLQG